MNQTAWLVWRSVLVIALAIGFYVLALTLVGILLGIVYAGVQAGEAGVRIALPCFFVALAILLSIVPRRDRFVAPGPLLTGTTEPQLFAFVRDIADRMAQPMPHEIYLVPDANAWVAQRGGFLGFGSVRVMGIGLPLLQALPRDEVTAILAHEFGHYASHDVRLGPWIYKTRKAIAQTVDGLDDSWLAAPFGWYSQMFLRLTFAISRRQEFVADGAAARVTGPQVLATALRRVSAVSPAYAHYFHRDVVPLLRAGYLPPVAEGFTRFLESNQFTALSARVVEFAEREVGAGAHDTHPPLRDRVAALGCAEAPGLPKISGTTTDLLSDAGAYTIDLMRQGIGDSTIDALETITWAEAAESVYVPQWRAVTEAYAPVLSRLTVETFPAGRQQFLAMADLLGRRGVNDKRVAYTIGILGAAVATRLLAEGWQTQLHPGAELAFVTGDRRCDPFALLQQLADGTLPLDDWIRVCGELSLTGPLCRSEAGTGTGPLDLTASPPAPSVRSTRRRRGY